MTKEKEPQWLKWAREIQALAQTGLTFTENHYEVQRNTRLSEIAAEIVAQYTNVPKDKIQENYLAQPGYATPKIDVRGAAIRDNKILLVQERTDQRWCMPGGWADVGDIPSEMVVREVREESGFEVEAKKVIAVFDANRSGRPMELYHAFKIIFLCDIVSGEARLSEETMGVEFFSFDNLPPLSSNRTNERYLAEVRAHITDPSRPTAFD